MSRHIGGRANFGYTYFDQKHYLCIKRIKNLEYEVASSLLRYFWKKKKEKIDESFICYVVQLDVEEQIIILFLSRCKDGC